MNITTAGGTEFQIDESDYEKIRLEKFNVCISRGNRRYIRIVGFGMLHRFLLNLNDNKMVVDHINGNTLDNRRENLRICSHTQNLQNSSKQTTNCNRKLTSKFKGVSFEKRKNIWKAQITVNKVVYRRRFKSEVNAALWYDDMAKMHFGQFARVNF